MRSNTENKVTKRSLILQYKRLTTNISFMDVAQTICAACKPVLLCRQLFREVSPSQHTSCGATSSSAIIWLAQLSAAGGAACSGAYGPGAYGPGAYGPGAYGTGVGAPISSIGSRGPPNLPRCKILIRKMLVSSYNFQGCHTSF